MSAKTQDQECSAEPEKVTPIAVEHVQQAGGDMKQWLQRTLRKRGYELRKAPHPNFDSVGVLDLSLHYLMQTRGQALNLIEVGANDGKSSDHLYKYIVNYPWRGLLVEPQPDAFERLKVNYGAFHGRLSFENVAISNDPKPITLYRAPKTDGSTVASSNKKTTAKQLQISVSDLEMIQVPTATIDGLIAKHRFENVDVLQLDTEGFEWIAMQTMDLRKTRPMLIGFEHGHLSPDSIGRMTRHLNDHGYQVHFGGYESDSVALRNDFLA